MSGKRLDADPFVKECQKVEAKMSFTELDTGFKAGMGTYCTQENIFSVGKAGKPFAFEMCDGESIKKMKAKHSDGLRIFCTPANAYRFGTTGDIYLNVCSKQEEEAFLTEYRKGRKVWLGAVIKEKEYKLQQLQAEISGLEGQRASVMAQQRMIIVVPIVKHEQVYDPKTGTYQERTTQQPDPVAQARRDQLDQQLRQVNGDISSKSREVTEVSNELSKMRTEMATL